MCKTCSAVQRARPDTQSNNIWHLYRIRAKKQGIPFELDQQQFRDIITRDCTYCGNPPQSVEHPNTNYGEDFYHNGIDRQDSIQGYVKGNCVPCCGTCNYMKGTMSVSDFLTWADLVTAGSQESKDYPLTERQSRAVRQGYESRAKRHGFAFTLDPASFHQLVSQSCSYCGASPSNSQAVSYRGSAREQFLFTGVDRIDPSKGYLPDNCRSACWACNNAKGAKTVEDFLGQVRRIADYQRTSSSSRKRNTWAS